MHQPAYPLAGRRLREIREGLGLTLKDVEEQSRRLVALQQDSYYLLTAGRLSQLENSNSLPSLYKLATLSFIYRIPLNEMFRIYGVDIVVDGKETGEKGSASGSEATSG